MKKETAKEASELYSRLSSIHRSISSLHGLEDGFGVAFGNNRGMHGMYGMYFSKESKAALVDEAITLLQDEEAEVYKKISDLQDKT